MWFMTEKAVWSSGGSLSSWTLLLQMTLDSDSDTEEQKIREIPQMAKKKKLTKAERKEARLRYRQAVAAYLYRLTEKDEQALPGTLSCGFCDGR